MVTHRSAAQREDGFTLIELLVVMIIIGILAAIAIPTFLSQQGKARDTSTKADVSALGKEIATYFVDGTTAVTVTVVGNTATVTGGTYTGTVKFSAGTSVPAANASSGLGNSIGWCVALTNLNGSQKYYSFSATNGLSTTLC